MPDVARVSRHLPWREAAKDVDSLRPMLLEQVRHEDLRGRRVLDVGTGEGRLAFVAASVGARVIGVDLDRVKLMHARAYAGIRDFRNTEFVLGEVELYLRDATVRRWVEDGRWQELTDAFARRERHLTLSYLIVKARRTTAPYTVE